MMKAILIRHSFPDRPSWIIVKEDIPLGKRYEVLDFASEGCTIMNFITGEMREVPVFRVLDDNGDGWIPAVCLKVIES
jgi:hypothetical protein